MKKFRSIPKADKFHMTGEFEPHKATIMVWPVRPGSWPNGGTKAQEKFTEIAQRIAVEENVIMLADAEHIEQAKKMLGENNNITVLAVPTNDSWARDIAPTCVIDDAGQIRGIDWKFNAWGGEIDGLYKDYEQDNAAASAICEDLDMDVYDAQDFVMEGGAIHSDGEGTILVTESCLLSKGRNPKMSKDQITKKLCDMLGAKKVIWIPYGIYMDETNEHVDNVCCFTKPGEVVLAWTNDMDDPQYKMSTADLQVLISERDAKGRKLKVHKLLLPKKPVCVTKEDLEGYTFAEGETQREEGERLAASYVNFYICNGAVLVPQFGDKNDAAAVKILAQLFPDREIVPVASRDILVGGGNIHCITQQIPMTRVVEHTEEPEEKTEKRPERRPERRFDRGSERRFDRGSGRRSDKGSDRRSDRGSDRRSDRGNERRTDRGSERRSDRGSERRTESGWRSDRGNDRRSDRGSEQRTDRGSEWRSDRGSDRKPERRFDRNSEGKRNDNEKSFHRGVPNADGRRREDKYQNRRPSRPDSGRRGR